MTLHLLSLNTQKLLENKPGFSVFSVVRGLTHSAGHRADQQLPTDGHPRGRPGHNEASQSDGAGFRSWFPPPLSHRAFLKGPVRIQVGKRPLGAWDES